MSLYQFIYQRAIKMPVLVAAKRLVDRLDLLIFYLQRKTKFLCRTIFSDLSNPAPTRKLCILCVKNVEYLHAAILNINSLHFFNQLYHCEIYCDDACFREFKTVQHFLDYPDHVSCINAYGRAGKPWQYYKLKTLERISCEDCFLVDADSRWYGEPKIDTQKVIFLTPAYQVASNKAESDLVNAMLSKNYPQKLTHYATGFLYIPRQFSSKDLWNKIWRMYEKVIQATASAELLRLKDEIAINVGIQTCLPAKVISVLKETDGPGNKNLLQSYYYGCWNQIIS